MQFSALYFGSLQCNTVQYSTVQRGYCCAVQLSAFLFSLRKMILMSVLLSAQVERLSASRMQECFLEIGYLFKFFYLNYIFHMLSEILLHFGILY